MSTSTTSCELCQHAGGDVLWQDELCRVIRVQEAGYPDFCRVVWHAHVAEMTDLAPLQRQHLMKVVLATETALRQVCQPDKINLASLGNVVPHLHWHVIPRYRDDRHFPRPIWAEALRPEASGPAPADRERLCAALSQVIHCALGHHEKG